MANPYEQVAYDDAISRSNRQQSQASGYYKFPLNNQDEYPGIVQFRAFQEDYSVLQQIVNTVTETRDIVTTGSINDQPGNELSAADQVAELQAADASLQTRKGTKPIKNYGGTVTLYLPPSIQFSDGVSYDNTPLGTRGAAVAAGIQSGKTPTGILATALGGGFTAQSFRELFQTGLESETGQLLANRTIGKLGADVQGAIESSTGITLNPNTRSLLRAVNHRSFNFSFKMIPTSEKESRQIRNIINFFRTEMYPDDVLPAGEFAAGYRFPSKFDISMLYKNRRITTGILPCFLTNFQTNYNPNSMGMLKKSDGSGEFPEIDISMSFTEHRTLRKKDIESGY